MTTSKILASSAMALTTAGLAFGNTPLLVNTGFDGFEGWVMNSNLFVGGAWQQNVGTYSGPDGPYQFSDLITVSGNGHVFTFWDDEKSDMIENFLIQEFGAGPAESGTPSVFSTGDVLVFKGSASATRVGADTTDMKTRAFIKVLGYNELGWAFQVKDQYSAFHDIGSALEPFELSVTFPDLAVDDSLQILQIGFEITGSFDGTAMDKGTIYFENLEGYIQGASVTWAGYEVDSLGWINTGAWMGYLNVTADPWIWVNSLAKYIYMPESNISTSGAWIYVMGN